jgi:hypothetical protein
MSTLRTDSWWTRMMDRFRGSTPAKTRLDLPDVGEDGLLSEPAELLGPSSEGDGQSERPVGALARWSKRDQTLAKLQEGYERVTQVVEAVQKHLSEQGERTERIASALENLARTTSDLPNTTRQQVETLQAMAGHLETTNARTQQLNETMSELPKVARLQTETLSGIKRQLDMTNEQNLLTSQTMDKLGGAINSLGEFNSAQTQVLRDMGSSTVHQNELLTKLIAKQSRRFLMLFVVTVILASAAVTAAIVAISIRH